MHQSSSVIRALYVAMSPGHPFGLHSYQGLDALSAVALQVHCVLQAMDVQLTPPAQP